MFIRVIEYDLNTKRFSSFLQKLKKYLNDTIA